MKQKRTTKKAVVAKAKKAVKQSKITDQFGFGQATKSHRAIALIAAGKMTEARKEFGKALSFNRLFGDLKKRGWAVKQNGDKSSIEKTKA